MLIYRVANSSGTSMYKGSDVLDVDYNPEDRARHPNPHDDAGLNSKGGREWWDKRIGKFFSHPGLFAFATLDQLKAWIYKKTWREALEREGFYIHVMEVPDGEYVIGDAQAIYDHRHAKEVATLKLTEV